ncbi:hypothetical protein SeMB42_g05609 [Synchytrium endobioticum]|uniref:Uncharacterized protein n=1 Tax=Synchytrium endobioticum TaxID=286115 RepID=A0A507DHY5_9FUNG|nr:hypothetical protein SeMB42_g05609 [Synchytrium endobioticum]TPX51204.1 hypothetical protein SeLEV6574_g00421 [Synchytrium endobioticum]
MWTSIFSRGSSSSSAEAQNPKRDFEPTFSPAEGLTASAGGDLSSLPGTARTDRFPPTLQHQRGQTTATTAHSDSETSKPTHVKDDVPERVKITTSPMSTGSGLLSHPLSMSPAVPTEGAQAVHASGYIQGTFPADHGGGPRVIETDQPSTVHGMKEVVSGAFDKVVGHVFVSSERVADGDKRIHYGDNEIKAAMGGEAA